MAIYGNGIYSASPGSGGNTGSGGITGGFINLTDTPFTYSGAAGRFVVVNGSETGLIFYNPNLQQYATIARVADISAYLQHQFDTLDITYVNEQQLIEAMSQVYSISASYTPNVVTADISANLQSQLNTLNVAQYIVFQEQFLGNGSSNTFQLSGGILNATFIAGTWDSTQIQITQPVDITDLNEKPIYDGIIPVLRNRINVFSINSSGLVVTDFIPRNNQSFYLWYWYKLKNTDRISDYIRPDYISKMEESAPFLASNVYVNTVTFSGDGILTYAEDTVQKALEKLDNAVINISGTVIGNYVSLDKDETINGVKNFSTTPEVSGSYKMLHDGNITNGFGIALEKNINSTVIYITGGTFNSYFPSGW